MIWVTFLACAPDPDGGDPDSTPGLEEREDAWSRPAPGGWPRGGPLTRPGLDVDVVVVGAGPAGLAAATTIDELGLSVALLDRDDHAGQGVVTGARCFAAGTSYQAAEGVTDSAAQALAEWDSFAGSGSTEPGVIEFVEHSAENLDWLVARGTVVENLQVDLDAGSVRRMHGFHVAEGGPVFAEQYAGQLVLNASVEAPVIQGGRVAGVQWVDRTTGEAHTLRANAVVMATGGFARDMDLVASLDPSLEGREALVEANLESDGGGISFMDQVGAGWSERERLGIYIHGVRDPQLGGQESLIGTGFETTLMVDTAGARFGNEWTAYTFDTYAHSPTTAVWAVFTASQAGQISFSRPTYNVTPELTGEVMDVEDLVSLGAEVVTAGNPDALASAAGIDVLGLMETIDSWNAAVAAAEPDPFGRDTTRGPTYGGDTWYAVRIHPAIGKSFGGVDTAVTGEVLALDGTPIPGLYAAGEVAGMVLGGGAHGMFSGSVCACYYGGRVAGASAAAAALALR